MIRRVDAWGRTTFDSNTLIDLVLKGIDISEIISTGDAEVEEYNKWCEYFDKSDYFVEKLTTPLLSPEEENQKRISTWMIGEDIQKINIRSFILEEFCKTQEQIDRVNLEMDLYEERDLIPVLQLMMFLVDHFRQNNVVWGCGRGSSVSSYVLFLLGVHHIDSLRYNLDIFDFLK